MESSFSQFVYFSNSARNLLISIFIFYLYRFQIIDKEAASKIDQIIARLKEFQSGEKEFTFIIEDISGNSYIENPFAPIKDPSMTVEYFTRSSQQDTKLGIFQDESKDEDEEDGRVIEVETREEKEGLLMPLTSSVKFFRSFFY